MSDGDNQIDLSTANIENVVESPRGGGTPHVADTDVNAAAREEKERVFERAERA